MSFVGCGRPMRSRRDARPQALEHFQEHFQEEHFQEKHAPGLIGGGMRFSFRKCDNAKMPERFLFPANVKPL
jgi:hypothetical protein